MKEVVIEITDGVAEIVSLPEGVSVKIVDHDWDGPALLSVAVLNTESNKIAVEQREDQ